MKNKLILPTLFSLGILSSSSAFAVSPTVLYDPSLGGLPETQGKLFYHGTATETALTSPTAASELNTESAIANQAGWGTLQPALLNNATGYTLNFTFALSSESRDSSVVNRAGFDVIITSATASKAIELAFWPTQIFALEGGSPTPAFTAAETALINTTTLQNYQLSVLGNAYTLYDNNTPILTGPLRDYTGSPATLPNIPVQIYTQSGLVFLGDDTTEAGADILLQQLSITPAAVPEPASLGLLTLGALGLFTRRQKSR